MSTLSVSYSSLKDSSNESKSVAKKLNSYADSIEKTVYNKLNKYNGDWTSGLSNAKNKANTKISELRKEAGRYNTYAADLIDLRDECKNVDKSVKSKISTLTANFKEAYGIRNSKVENAVSYFFTSIGNSSSAGRWLNDKADLYRTGKNYLKDRIKEWYNFEGGKDLIKGVLIGLLEVAIGVVSIIAAVLSGGALLVIIAGVIAGVIAVANGIANICNEKRAYDATQRNDPATGKRLSAENTIQDFLRDGDITDEKGDSFVNKHIKLSRNIATGIDIVNFCCTVVTVVSSCKELLQNGYRWATGSTKELKDIGFKDVFSKDTFSKFGTKIKTNFADIKSTLKFKNWSQVKDFGSMVLSDFKFNLSKSFTNFSNLKGFAKTSKNYMSITKDLLSGESLIKVIFNKILVPNIQIFSVNEATDSKVFNDFFNTDSFKDISIERITLKDFVDIPKDFIDDIVNAPLFEKFSTVSDINISIPEIQVPDINFDINSIKVA